MPVTAGNIPAAADLSNKNVSVDAMHTGFYCALASASHGSSVGDESPSPTGFKDIKGHWAEANIEYLKILKPSGMRGSIFTPTEL